MSPATADETPRLRASSGEQEKHLAISTLAQQGSQVVGVATMLVAVTVLARNLTLSEFGTYGLLLSLSAYVAFIQGSVDDRGGQDNRGGNRPTGSRPRVLHGPPRCTPSQPSQPAC